MRRFVLVLATLLLGMSLAEAKPKAVLLGGFGWPLTSPISYLAPKLTAMGYDVRVCSHFCLLFGSSEKIDLVIGHSLGGDAALGFARFAKSKPKTVMIDPTRMNWGCPTGVKCFNVYNSWHLQAGGHVLGATNVDCAIAANGCAGISHIPMAASDVIWAKIAAWLKT